MQRAQVATTSAAPPQTRLFAAALATTLAAAVIAVPAAAAATDGQDDDQDDGATFTAAMADLEGIDTGGLDYEFVFDNEPFDGDGNVLLDTIGEPTWSIGLDGINVTLNDAEDVLAGQFAAPDDVTTLGDVNTMFFETRTDTASTGVGPSIPTFTVVVGDAERVDEDPDGLTMLVFNPDEAGTDVTEGDWQTWDAFADGDALFTSTEPIAGAPDPDVAVSWDDIVAENANAVVLSYGFSAGPDSEGFSGAVNNFRLNNQVVTYTLPGGWEVTAQCSPTDETWIADLDLDNLGSDDFTVLINGDAVEVPAGETVTLEFDDLTVGDDTIDVFFANNDLRNDVFQGPDDCTLAPVPVVEEPDTDPVIELPTDGGDIAISCTDHDGAVTAGEEVACAVTGLDAGADIAVTVTNGDVILHAEGLIADANGVAEFLFVVPADTPAGDVLAVTAVDSDGGTIAALQLTVAADEVVAAAAEGQLPRTGTDPAILALFASLLAFAGSAALTFTPGRR